MSKLTSWTIPAKYWELLNPNTIGRFQQTVNNERFDKLSVPASVVEQMRIILSNTVDTSRVDISEIKKFNPLWITEGKIPLSKTNKWDNKYLHEVSKDDTVLVLNNSIRSILSSSAVFKIKVSEARSYSSGVTRVFYTWLASVELTDTSDNLTLLKLSLE